MKINKITFTGADNNTDINAMIDIAKKYSGISVEWGILISSNNNRNRYPSADFIKSLNGTGLNLALHLCGSYSRNIMSDGKLTLPYDFFDRYQINFNFAHTPFKLVHYEELIENYPDKDFILQYNKSNANVINEVLQTFFNLKNTNVLFDASGGRGVEIKQYPEPLNVYTGYSGGLNPENIQSVCEALTKMENQSNVWIDMESGVRTNDIFDLNKVSAVLDIVTKF